MPVHPFGGAATSANPTDCGKRGTKYSPLSEGRGVPLAVVVVAGANRTDMMLTEETLDHLMVERPLPTEEKRQHLCLDAGYEYDIVYAVVRAHHSVPYIRPNCYNRAHAKPTPEPEEDLSSNLESTEQPRC